MKKTVFLPCLLAGAYLLAGCAKHHEERDREWQTSTLPPETIESVQAGVADYQACINRRMTEQGARATVDMDSRAATDFILKACEDKLAAVRQAFLDQNVPESIADRYLKRKRTQTARGVLFQMMRLSAARQGQSPNAD